MGFNLGLISLVGLVFISAACTKRSDTSTLKLQMPELSASFSEKNMSYSKSGLDGIPWVGSFSLASDVNCYAVFVGGEEPALKTSSCQLSNNTTMNFGIYAGGIPAGGSIELEVPVGVNRKIYLVGTKTDTGKCIDFQKNEIEDGSLLIPRVMSVKKVDLGAGDQVVEMPFSADLSSAPELVSCKIEDGLPSGGDSYSELKFSLGDGSDGDIYINGNLTTNTATVSSSLGDVYMSYSARLYAISQDGSSVTVHQNVDPGVTSFFLPNDLVMVHTTAASASATDIALNFGPDNICGQSNHRGRFMLAKIEQINFDADSGRDQIVLDRPIMPSLSVAEKSRLDILLQEATFDPAFSWCRMQIIRVPQFNKMIVSASSELDVSNYDYADGIGGVFPFLVKDSIQFTAASLYLGINANEAGFKSASGNAGFRGADMGGYIYSSMAANDGAGSYDPTNFVGSGAGALGPGGTGLTAGFGGAGILSALCGPNCFPSVHQKLFLGAQGAGSSEVEGGSGGGVVWANINSVEHSNSTILKFKASGSSAGGSMYGSGGGAGGMVHVKIRKTLNSVSSAALQFYVDGGSSTTATNFGGGGAGGVADLSYCDSSVISTGSGGDAFSFASYGGVGYYSSASSGAHTKHQAGFSFCNQN